MVTWGQNQVFTFGNSPAPSATGASAGTGFSFGSTPAPPPPSGGLFGTPAPAPSGLFGAPAPSTAAPLFGSRPAGGLFGSAPSSTPSLFGSSAPSSTFGSTSSLFGSPSPAPFGSAPQQQQQRPQIPAQAAMQAHMDASARQEAAKLQSSLERVHQIYTGTSNSEKESSPFVTIVYNFMTPEQLQWQFSHQQSGGGIAVPPRPPSVSENDWNQAVVRNPDPTRYIPVALVGVEALQARLGWQQENAVALERTLNRLQGTQATLQQRVSSYQQDLKNLDRMHDNLRKRVLSIMAKVEVCRCMNFPLQTDEVKMAKRLSAILQNLEKAKANIASIPNPPATFNGEVEMPNRERLAEVLKGHRQGLLQLTQLLQEDLKDVRALQSSRLGQNIASAGSSR